MKNNSATALTKRATALMVLVPVIIAIIGFASISSFSAKLTADANATFGSDKSLGIAAVTHEFVSFLNAISKVDRVKDATEKSEAGEKAKPLITAYAENGFKVEDILITNSQGYVFASVSGDYNSTEIFRDSSELMLLASSPAPVSGFYDGGKFFCVRPVKANENTNTNEGNSGFVVLIAQADLVFDYVSQLPQKHPKEVFAIFDENENIISPDGEVSNALKDGVSAAKTALEQNQSDSYALFEKGGRFGATGNISGTSWSWVSLYPKSAVAPNPFFVFVVAFVTALTVCIICAIIIMCLHRKRNKEEGA